WTPAEREPVAAGAVGEENVTLPVIAEHAEHPRDVATSGISVLGIAARAFPRHGVVRVGVALDLGHDALLANGGFWETRAPRYRVACTIRPQLSTSQHIVEGSGYRRRAIDTLRGSSYPPRSQRPEAHGASMTAAEPALVTEQITMRFGGLVA